MSFLAGIKIAFICAPLKLGCKLDYQRLRKLTMLWTDMGVMAGVRIDVVSSLRFALLVVCCLGLRTLQGRRRRKLLLLGP